MLILVAFALAIAEPQTTVPSTGDTLGRERQVTEEYLDSQPSHVVRLASKVAAHYNAGRGTDVDPGNSNKIIFLFGRSDILFTLDDLTDDQSLSMYERQPGEHPDKALWKLEWRRDPKARNDVGIARLLSCDVHPIPKAIRRIITSRRPFAVYWTPSIFAGYVADLYLPNARHEISIAANQGLEFPTTRREQHFMEANQNKHNRPSGT